MTTIEKLSIQGIRSFGSKAEDMQGITFSSPVTLILGENGCGKTTIIECLKFALTGEAPPGSDRGKNFVHDPKIFSQTDSLGQIKLQVRNSQGQRLSVCRSLKVSSKRGKMQMETLDATVNYMDGGGPTQQNTNSISKRNLDVDVSMSDFMGVSKAIINNVIFCHQEDSSWPLDEAKKLKEKFDAIFGITEHNKAIEKVIKLRKEEVAKLKLKESELRLLAHLKQEMEDKTISLQKAEQKCESVREQCRQCDEEMKPIDERLAQIHKIEYEIGKYQALKVEIETKLKNCQDQIAGLTKKIKHVFDGDIKELDFEIDSFQQKMSAKKVERMQLEEKIGSLRVQEKGLQKVLSDLDKKQVVVTQQRQREKESIAQRAERMRSLCEQLSIEAPPNFSEDSQQVTNVLEDIQNGLLSERCTITELSSKSDAEELEYQGKIDTLRVNLSKLEERIQSTKKQRDTHSKEKDTTKSKISEIQVSAHRLTAVTKKLQEVDQLYNSKVKSFNQDEMKQKIADSKDKVARLQKQFSEVDKRLTFLNSISKQMAEIAVKEKDLAKKEQEVRRVKSKHSENFKRIFAQPVERNFRRCVQHEYEEMRRKVKALTEKEKDFKLKERSCEIERKNLKDELSRSEAELERLKEKIYEQCHSSPLEELLAKCKETMDKHQLDLGALRSSEAMYKKYIKKVDDDPCCPLCHKSMTENEVADITAELSDEIHHLPENIRRVEKLLKQEQKKYEGLLQLKPILEKVNTLEADIPKRRESLKKVQAKLAEYSNELESLQLLIAEPTANMDLSNSMMGDMSLLDEALKDVSRLAAEIEKLKGQLPQGSEASESIDDLQLEKTTVAGELQNERSSLDTLQESYEKVTNMINRLIETKNKYKEEEIKLQEGVQSLPQLEKRLAELDELLEGCDLEVGQLQSEVQPVQQNLKAIIGEKAARKEQNRKKISKLQALHDAHNKLDHEIQRLTDEIVEYGKLNLSAELKRLGDNMQTIKQDLKDKTQEIELNVEQLDSVKSDYLNQEVLERDLKDNRELKLLQESEQTLKERSDTLHKQLGDLDYRSVSREKTKLTEQREVATVRKGELLGQIGEIQNQIKRIKLEIEDRKFKDSVRNYKRGLFEVAIMQRVILDLGQHTKALEVSLMKFHAEKMERINSLIREYWRLIYRGNDIDYIQIQTDEINTDTTADKRRTYNYRVIQSKNNSEIEMRGRCSAGQRVLASLIIRMALAETFSSNCGVLALDEPTTNLDRANILSLCEALNRIVDDRQSPSNFMLVIITHDEDFISTLGKITSYHRVFRSDEGKSTIRKVKIV